MKSLISIFLSLYLITGLSGQLEIFQIEQFNKKMEVVMSDPIYSPHWPVGLIYRDTTDLAFTNLSDEHLRIADGPIGYQLVDKNVLYTEVKKDQFSINRFDNPFDGLFWIGPMQLGFWGPREPGNFGSQYDFNTWGDIYTKDILSRPISELTHCGGVGALKLYKYDGYSNYDYTLSINYWGNPIWKVTGSTIITGLYNKEKLLPKIQDLKTIEILHPDNKTELQGYDIEQIQELLPDLVSKSESGEIGINYYGFGTVAIQAIKEQQEIIKTLEDRIERLEKMMLEK